MKARLAGVFAMVLLVALALVTMPAPAAANCSGDNCGCYDGQPECIASCPPVEDPGHNACVHACIRGSVNCAVCCCCDYPYCPSYC